MVQSELVLLWCFCFRLSSSRCSSLSIVLLYLRLCFSEGNSKMHHLFFCSSKPSASPHTSHHYSAAYALMDLHTADWCVMLLQKRPVHHEVPHRQQSFQGLQVSFFPQFIIPLLLLLQMHRAECLRWRVWSTRRSKTLQLFWVHPAEVSLQVSDPRHESNIPLTHLLVSVGNPGSNGRNLLDNETLKLQSMWLLWR